MTGVTAIDRATILLVLSVNPGGGRAVVGRWCRRQPDLDLRANLSPDAVLAILHIEHGLEMISADSDFARNTEINWRNPLRSRPCQSRPTSTGRRTTRWRGVRPGSEIITVGNGFGTTR